MLETAVRPALRPEDKCTVLPAYIDGQAGCYAERQCSSRLWDIPGPIASASMLLRGTAVKCSMPGQAGRTFRMTGPCVLKSAKAKSVAAHCATTAASLFSTCSAEQVIKQS